MKSLFIEAKRKFENLSFDFSMISGFRRMGLLSTVQFLPIVGLVERELNKKHIKTEKSKTLYNETQILGCNVTAAEKIKDKVDAFLLLSSGKWHALMVSAIGKPVFIYNGERIEKIPEEDIRRFNARKKAALMKFLSEDKIGILVSLKPGQYHLKEALELKKKLDKKKKQSIIFIADTFNLSEFENYGMKIFVNTACPGMFFDSSNILNVSEIPEDF
jgi:2-(3-amino-3-carboxypropyl)histidine synthase